MNLKELHEFLDETPVKKPVSALIIKGTMSTVDCKSFGDPDALAGMLAFAASEDEQMKQVLTTAIATLMAFESENKEDGNED